ncbi:MAG: hypothetical protein ACD_73C00549G0002 [uncultured bacterium]|nr:MAG: hypothetical protein ACD_73C00549G0002 [uncultured bacterium]
MLFKQTLGLRYFGIRNIPLLFICSPSVLYIDNKRCEVKIPLNYLTKNHLGCMYFGALAMGADLAGGMMAMDLIEKSGKKVSLLFKDFHADYLKRAEGDVHFKCSDGPKIHKAVQETLQTGQRVNIPLHVEATTPKVSGGELVAKFILTLSLKAVSQAKT